MDKTRKVIISLSLALVIVLILNFIMSSTINSKFIEAYVFSKDILKGSKITKDCITIVKIKADSNSQAILENTLNKEEILDKIISKDVYSGEIVSKDKIALEESLKEIENFEYISLPVGVSSYATANKLKRGDKIIIYFTAKNKEVEKAISDTAKIYSSTNAETLVTSRLLEGVEVISTRNNTGNTIGSDGIVTDILVRLTKDESMLVANLKSQGTFDIVLVN